MPGDPRLRVSDADRERTVELLREHHAVGRLDAQEFHDRLEQAFAAKTRGELDALLADLPAIDLYRLPSADIRPVRRRGGSGPARGADGAAWLVAGWAGWTASTLAVLVWLGLAAATGGLAWIPWFLVIVLPWFIAASRGRRR